MQEQKFKELIEKYLSENADVEDMQQLSAMLEEPVYMSLLDEMVLDQVSSGAFRFDLDDAIRNRIDQRIYQKTLPGKDSASGETTVRSVRRTYSIGNWGWAAAVLLAGMMIAIAFWPERSSKLPKNEMAASPVDILPGTNKAVLTVDDRQINLSSDKTGITVGENIAYSDGEQLSGTGKMLALTTPNGGQYQLVLPDGTRAWLNAASSISFPSVFDHENRLVRISGEVYLEVAKDKKRPFLVDVAGQSRIEVLGTSFNVNAYGDDGKIQTTLVDGSIRVGAGAGAFTNHAVILKPGQRATIAVTASGGPYPENTSPKILVDNATDPGQAIAWKNGLFSFSNAGLHSAMRQLERWYDIKVRYEGKNSSITLSGEMYRNVKLSDVLEFLKESGLAFRMEGKTLIVL